MRALRAFHDAVVAPRWDSVVSSFHADVARRMPVLAAGGHQALFGTLDEQLRWRDDGLDRKGNDWEYELGGTGLLLIPSAFWSGPPVFAIGDGVRLGNALMYAARPNGQPAEPALRTRPGTTAWPLCSAPRGPPCCARWPNRAARRSWPTRWGSARPRRPSTRRCCATRT